ncbi:PC4 and SFRS1-interacting protein [Homalodisca vitripennis]|nr:PC4 and SFRS1-interacting protein [Homalodisca vitripennis]
MATDTNALYEVGVMVFAKVKGYPYWPAVIKGVTKTDRTTKYNVTFFGDENTANVKQNDMCLYSEYKLIHGKPKTDNFKNKKFNEALKEAETFFKNPSCNKSLTESNSNKTLKGYISQDSILESTLPELEESLIESELQNGEDSLIMAAKLGKALLKENEALKEDNRRLNFLLNSMEAKIENYSREEETYLSRVENFQQKISDMDRQLGKEKQLLIDTQQIFEDHDRRQAQVLNDYEQKIKELSKEILILKKRLKTQENMSQEKVLEEAGTQTDSPQFSVAESTPLVTEIVQLKNNHYLLEQKLNRLNLDSQNRAENLTNQKKREAVNQSHNSLKKQKINGNSKNKFSISLQVQKIKEQTTYPKEPYNNPVLTISDKQRPIPTCIPRDKGDFEVIEVEAMFHRENICTMPESKDYKKPAQKSNKSPPCTAKLKAPNETYQDFFDKYIEHYKATQELTTTNEKSLSPHLTTVTENTSQKNNHHFLDQTQQKKIKFKNRYIINSNLKQT